MAVVWAKSNGNWTDTTLWAFWNEITQQIEDYGQIPQNGDIVFLNSYTVTMNIDINIGNGIITNKINPYTQQNLGYILDNTATARNITSNIEGYLFSNNILSSTATGAKTININGNVKNCTISIRYSRLTINGNVEDCVFNLNTISNSTGCNLTINGNFLNNISSIPINFNGNGSNSTSNFTINGNITDNGANYFLARSMITNVSINGNFMSSNTFMFCSTELRTFLINGIYSSTFSNWVITRQLYVGENTHFILTDRNNIPYGFSTSGIFNPDYPAETDVKKDIPYAFNQMVGTYDINQYLPPETVVLKDYEYGDSDDRKTGTMVQEVNVEVGCVTKEDVREGVPLIGMYEEGQQVVGSLVVPSVDDVREGVVFDNGSVGTLIVEGGGDRLRIADFGYYTNAQSDTYIVDLTEQDKPKFAVAEERVLIEMFPDLHLENIPEKYFDDLFVKYLKYRLIVEYYRTAGINSTFTPSEPATEIVNYQNVRNEVWLNSANIYLKAWAKKYPESIVKPQRILL